MKSKLFVSLMLAALLAFPMGSLRALAAAPGPDSGTVETQPEDPASPDTETPGETDPDDAPVGPDTPTMQESDKEGAYKFKLRIFAGERGHFDPEKVKSTLSGAGVFANGSTGYTVEASAELVEISGLDYADYLADPTASLLSCLEMENDVRYYARGAREAGLDNAYISSAPQAMGDRDYVIAYGIRGNMVKYTVNYVDETGRALAPSQTYYGNVGERPVVAFLYINDYVPQALNLTKTLLEDESKNVFTFTYTFGGRTVVDEVVLPTVVLPGGGGGGAGGGAGGAGGAGAPDAGGVDVAPDDTPLNNGPVDLLDLDENDTPLGNLDLNDNSDKAAGVGKMVLSGAVAVASVAGLGFIGLIAFLVFQRRKKEDAKQ